MGISSTENELWHEIKKFVAEEIKYSLEISVFGCNKYEL